MFKSTGYLVLLAFAAFSCKTSRVATTTEPVPAEQAAADSTRLEKPVYVTQRGDTLDSLDLELSLDVYPVLADTLTVIGVGDIMLGTNYPSEEYLPPSDGSALLAEVDTILQDADITFGNYEGVLLNDGGEPKECKNPKFCYLFRTPESYAAHLTAAGFDVMSLANNHAGDFGETGRLSSARVLNQNGIASAGILSQPYTIFEASKTKIGFAAFAPNVGTVSIHNYENARTIIQHLDSVCQIVIVSFHAGGEGTDFQHVNRQREFFVGEDRGNVYEFARVVIDAGADVVFGHGPHVTRAVDLYKKKFIAYSLGNFCTYRRFNLRGANGIAPIVKVWVDGAGDFLKGQIYPTQQLGSGGPVLDGERKATRIVQQLTAADFPESALEIFDDGLITFKQSN